MPVIPDASVFVPKEDADALGEIERQLIVGKQQLLDIASQLKADMRDGLAEDGKTIPMIPSYVTRLPTGKENDTFLALDLGGTNLRVCEVKLDGRSGIDMDAKKYVVDEKYKTGTSDKLFDYIADCIGDFVKEKGHDRKLALGFTFSFAIKQTAVDKGALLSWSKGFSLQDALGKDVVEMLRAALKRKNVDVHVTAILNDTVGTVLASAYQHNEKTVAGFIFGTGTNAAYAEKVEDVPKYKGARDPGGFVLINTEWGAFDAERRILPFTKWDEAMDAESPNAGKHRLEKLISGMYLGEVVRRLMIDLGDRGLLFEEKPTEKLRKMWAFDTKNMAAIESDTSKDLVTANNLFQDHFQLKTTLVDRQMIHRLCNLVSERSARISAAAVAGLLMGKTAAEKYALPSGTLAFDGSVYNLYPGFADRMKSTLAELLGPDVLERYQFKSVPDGSGIGAAALAAAITHPVA